MKGHLCFAQQGPAAMDVGGPYFPGRAIYALAYDDRNGRTRLWAAVNSLFGAHI